MNSLQTSKINATLNKIVYKEKNNKHRMIQDDSVYNLRSLFINNVLLNESFNDSPYKNFFINYLLKAETFIKGGSYLLLSLYLKKFNRIATNNKNLPNNISSLNKMIELMSSNKYSESLIKEILTFSGADSSILCRLNNNAEIQVSKKLDPQIKVNLHEAFKSVYFSNQKSITKNFLTICMDAYIERESEISPLITKAYDDKKSILIFSRGYSDNFIRNIKSVIAKNKVYVYPYIVKFDNEDPFLLKDIASILNLEIYSAEQGDNITNTIQEKASDCLVKVSSDNIVIKNPDKSIQKNINESIQKSKDADLRKYLLKRKKRLTSNTTEVLVPKSNKILFEEIKNIIHSYNNCVVSGFVSYEDYIYPKNVYNKIENLSQSLIKNISNISVVVKIKDKENV